MKTFKIMTILLLVLCTFAPAQDVTLDLQLFNPTMQVLSLGDLDFTNTGLVSNLFNILISNTGAIPQTLSLTLKVRYNGVEIASGTTAEFVVPGNFSTTISSQQLSAGTAQISGQFISLGDYDVNLNAVPGFENQAIQSGLAPAGTYEFVLIGEPGSITDQTDNIIIISNPTYIELLFPGNSVSDPVIMEINTTTPYAQWQTDVQPGLASYNIFFYQKNEGDVSVQDVLNNPPVLQVEEYPNNFLQYPPASIAGPGFVIVRPLEAGKTYYWYVRSIIQGATGQVIIESDVFRFKIADLAQVGNNAQQIIAILQQMLGPNFQQTLTNLTEQGFDPNGDITLDGQSGDLTTLINLANQVVSGQISIENVEIY